MNRQNDKQGPCLSTRVNHLKKDKFTFTQSDKDEQG